VADVGYCDNQDPKATTAGSQQLAGFKKSLIVDCTTYADFYGATVPLYSFLSVGLFVFCCTIFPRSRSPESGVIFRISVLLWLRGIVEKCCSGVYVGHLISLL
jgi:hypothetical protein